MEGQLETARVHLSTDLNLAMRDLTIDVECKYYTAAAATDRNSQLSSTCQSSQYGTPFPAFVTV